MGYWKEIIEGGWSLVEGMRVTVRRLFRPVVTVQYPRKRLTMSPAYRGHIELKAFEETGTHRCIACGTCQRTCPSGVIKVQGVKSHARAPKVATHYLIDYTRCSLCGLCVECCPTQTLQFSVEYQLAGECRWDGVYDLMARLEGSKS
jgi:NADH-quinone oxidoreductase subunit I